MYHHVFIAGTFDGLHKGHEAVLSRAFAEGEHVTVGITTDEFVKKFKLSALLPPEALAKGGSSQPSALSSQPSALMPFDQRKKRVEEWVAKNGWSDKTTFIDVNDPHEPAASGDYDAIIVTSQNRQTGEKINSIREERQLPQLTLLSVDIIPAHDGLPISSTRMRNREIDAWGRLILPDQLRPELKEPMGEIVRITDLVAELKGKTSLLVTVGDMTTDRMLINGIIPDLAIIDLYVRRQPYKALHEYAFPKDVVPVHMKSGPGYISLDALTFISGWGKTHKKFVLVIHGEDDLLVLPAIYYAPLGTTVLYGQPGVGIVRLVVTHELQKKAQEYLEKFKKE